MGKKMSHEDFLNKFKTDQPLLYEQVEVVGNYIGSKKPIRVKTKYGFCIINARELYMFSRLPSIRCAENKTEYFSNILKERQPDIYNKINIIGEYIHGEEIMRVETKYGVCLPRPSDLLVGYMPSISIAENKTEYFKNVLKERSIEVYNNVEIIGEYTGKENKIKVLTKYGVCNPITSGLLGGHMPTIEVAENKDEYMINMAIEIHGDKYGYDNAKFKGAFEQLDIYCKKCDDNFQQAYNSHINNKQGCSNCKRYSGFRMSNWIKDSKTSSHFESFKVYILKCWNDSGEVFFKIGRTFVSVKNRFTGNKKMPYNYEIVKTIVSDNGEYIWNLERDLHILHRKADLKYIPLIPFGGSETECFTQLLPEIIDTY